MSQPFPPAVPAAVAVPAGTTAAGALEAAGVGLDGPSGAVVVRERATGELRDLGWAPEADVEVEPVALDSDAGRAVLRHSAAHVLAQAVQDLFPGTRLGIGPPIENGFYYDFLPERPFTPEDLSRLEKRMQEIVKAAQRFSRRPVGDDEARAELAHEPFKLELIDLKGAAGDAAEGASAEVGAGQLTMYDNLDRRSGERVWTDLCRGPHLPSTRRIPAFKLTHSAAAYWRGSERNPQLQRIYGTAWESKDALAEHLRLLAEAEKRDHRRLGAELDLFSFPPEIGSGLPVFHPNGGIIRRELENYSRHRHERGGYEFVNTPHITKEDLFLTSGHLPSYADTMFPPITFEGADYYLKPMNCPFHILIYAVPRAVLPGAAAAAVRVRHRLPVREVRRRARPDPGARADHGRRAHLLHQGAGARRAGVAAGLRARPAARLRARRLLPGAVHPGRLAEVHRRSEGLGGGDRRAGDRRRQVRAGAGRRSGWGRVLRAEDLGAGPGRDRPDLADVHHPGRRPAAAAVRAGVPVRRRIPAAPGDDPPRAVRLDRALLRHPDRALRRRVPGLAGAGAGGRHPGDRRARALPRRLRRPAAGARHPGRGRLLRRPDAEEDPHLDQAEGAVPAHRRRRRRRGRRPCPSATGTAPSATACRSTGRSRRSSTSSGGGRTPGRPRRPSPGGEPGDRGRGRPGLVPAG